MEEGPCPTFVNQEGFLEEGRVSLASGDEPRPLDQAQLRGRVKLTAPFAPKTSRCWVT